MKPKVIIGDLVKDAFKYDNNYKIINSKLKPC
jgi:hypothetical protein